MAQDKQLTIRSSTAEFLIFEQQTQGDGIEVRYEDETLWITQKMLAALFDVEANTITYHLQEIFASGELERETTTRNFRVVQTEGARQVSRPPAYPLNDGGLGRPCGPLSVGRRPGHSEGRRQNQYGNCQEPCGKRI